MAGSIKSFPYSVHPAVAHMQAIADNLPKKTGKSLQEWIALVEAEGPAGEKERMAWLKAEHQLGRDTAMTILEFAAGRQDYDPEALVEAMFAGPKAALAPLYARLMELGLSLGEDVKAAPCSTYVPLSRKRQFAVIKPTTRTRVDLGLALVDVAPSGRMAIAKGLGGARITHGIGISSLEDIDEEVVRWLKAAYDQDA